MQSLILALIFLATTPIAQNSSVTLTEPEQKRLEQFAPQTLKKIQKSAPLNVQDVILMTRQGLPDKLIIEIIEKTSSTFFLHTSDIKEMRQMGVSQKVIEKMSETGKYNYS
jgi:hypothetical protein